MNDITVSLPMCICPHCDQSFQFDDYHDTEAGDSFECPVCGLTIYVHWVDHTITANLATEAE